MIIRLLLILSFTLLACQLCGCTEEGVPEGRIRVKNEIMDREYNTIQVYASGASYSLAPGEKALLPKGSTQITFYRAYRNYSREYVVQCPAELKKGISMKLIDVHMNRLPGGCQTVSAQKR